MSDRPTLVFIHGVGNGDPDDEWAQALGPAVREAGYANGLDGVTVLAPKYPKTARYPADDRLDLPGLTISSLSRAAARTHAREYQRRISLLEGMLGEHSDCSPVPSSQRLTSAAINVPQFTQARRYCSDADTRARVLARMLAYMPVSGRVVIVAHSLGSVVAADLVRRLPVDVEVTGLVTIGSPLSARSFQVGRLTDELRSPPSNLGWWINFWSASDPVTMSRGISGTFPWVFDRRVATSLNPSAAHAATRYLATPEVARVIGFGLYGSTSTEIVLSGRGVDAALDLPESLVINSLAYAHDVAERLTGETKERLYESLRRVQARSIGAAVSRRASGSPPRPVPTEIGRLVVDLSVRASPVPRPRPIASSSIPDAITFLSGLAMANVLAPYEIDIPEKIRKEALGETARQMGFSSTFGTKVFDSYSKAQDALKGNRKAAWIVTGVGIGIVVLATGGLAAAVAAPGLAGAAAVTSALAGFGPGGMIGGLLTAGTMVSTGSTVAAVGLAGTLASVEQLERTLVVELTVALAREQLGQPQDPRTWLAIVEVVEAVRAELARHEGVSDPKSETIKTLQKKLSAADNAVKCLLSHGLGPESADFDFADE